MLFTNIKKCDDLYVEVSFKKNNYVTHKAVAHCFLFRNNLTKLLTSRLKSLGKNTYSPLNRCKYLSHFQHYLML